MDPRLNLQVVCRKCGHEEIVGYAALKSAQTHNCAQCGEAIDLTPYLRMGDEFANRYGFSGDANPGLSDSAVPVPTKPAPTHHLVAAKELPPSDKTQSLRKD